MSTLLASPPLPPAAAAPLAGRRVAVTGGTSGLGLALVEQLAAARARVAFVARHQDGVDRVTERLSGAYGIVGDVSRKHEIHPIALQLTSAFGGIDVLINNASSLGPVPLVPLADTECEDLEEAIATNLLGPFRLTKALLGALSRSARDGRGGLVVNISSDAATTAYPGWGAYGASKAALLHLSRIWHEELVPLGISVVSFDPGDMDTPLHAAAVPDADRSSLASPASAAAALLDMVADRLGAGAMERTEAARG